MKRRIMWAECDKKIVKTNRYLFIMRSLEGSFTGCFPGKSISFIDMTTFHLANENTLMDSFGIFDNAPFLHSSTSALRLSGLPNFGMLLNVHVL